jgi:hypothetical protein
MKRLAFLFLLLFSVSSASAQNAGAEASLGTVDSAGFYAVPLGPGLTKFLDVEREKLRLLEDGKETPFILGGARIERIEPRFEEYPVLETKTTKEEFHLILEAPEEEQKEPLTLYTKSPDSLKRVIIEGSKKGKAWDTVRTDTAIRSSVKDTSSSEFHLPLFLDAGYELYRIRVRDASGQAPSVVSLGRYRRGGASGNAFWELPVEGLVQKEEAKTSYVAFRTDTLRRIDRAVLHLDGPPFFRRRVLLGIPKDKAGSVPYAMKPIGSGVLSDTQEVLTSLQPVRSQDFQLRIEKGPDPPLKVHKIRLFQKKRFLIAHFEKGHAYQLRLGGDLEPAPDYELKDYRDRIPNELPFLEADAPKRLAASSSDRNGKRGLIGVWIVLILSIVLIGTLTVRMVEG